MTFEPKFSAYFLPTNVGYCCFEGIASYCEINQNLLGIEIGPDQGVVFQFHKWAPYPGTTAMDINSCIMNKNNLPQKLPLTDADIIEWWKSPKVYNDDGSYKGGAYAETNLPLCDPEWVVGLSIEGNHPILFELNEEGIRDPKTGEIIEGSEKWCWTGQIHTGSGIYKTFVCYCLKTWTETKMIVPMPQEAYDVLLGVIGDSNKFSSRINDNIVLKLGIRAYNSKTDIGGAYVSGAGETKTYADHKKLSKSVRRAIEEELGIDFSNIKKASIYCLGIRDSPGRDARYYHYSVLSKSKRELVYFGHQRYSKTTVFFVLVEFNDPEKKDLPHTDVEEIQSTAWVTLSDALKIPAYQFFIPENSTYLRDVSLLLRDYQTLPLDEIKEKYKVEDLVIEQDD